MVRTGILGNRVLGGSREFMLEASQQGKRLKEIPAASASGVLKMRQTFVCCAVKGLEDTALPLWFQMRRVKGPFDRRQLRRKDWERRSKQLLCLKFKGCAC